MSLSVDIYETIPHVTLASQSLISNIVGSKVSEKYSGSDHRYTVVSLHEERRQGGEKAWRRPNCNVSKLIVETFVSEIKSGEDYVGEVQSVVETVMELIPHACEVSLPRGRKSSR